MNLLPIDLYLWLFPLVPFSLCWAGWGCGLRFRSAVLMCAPLSWGFFMLWFGVLDPPRNPVTGLSYAVTGWFWMLPLLGAGWLLFRGVGHLLGEDRRRVAGRFGWIACTGVAAVLLGWGLFGRMSGARAVHEARQQLISRGHSVGGPAETGWQRGRWTYFGWRPGHWVVGFPEVEAGEVALTRNGRLVWIGGPSH